MKTKSLSQLALILSLAATTSWVSAETPKQPEPTPKAAKPATAPQPLTTTITDSVSFSTLAKALKAAELDVTLADPKGVFTIFAPTDDAFNELPAGTLTKLLLPQNKQKLRSLLLFHVVAGKVLAADLTNGEVTTMNGEKIKIDIDGEKIEINDTKVFSADVPASNGVMHSIGAVLVPKSLDGFANLAE